MQSPEMLAEQKRTNAILEQIAQNQGLNAVNSVNFTEFTPKTPRKRMSKKMQKTVEWLRANPDKWDLTSREIADQIGVSHTTVANAKREIDGD